MAGDRAVLFGGPLDGHTTAPRDLPFVWVAPAKNSVRVFDEPGPRRLLYRRDDNGWRLVFAGYTHARCEDCDTIQPREGDCCLCGGRFIAA